MPPIRGGGFGDLYIDLTVETPVNLSSEQKELLRKFDSSGKDNHPAGKDFISIVKKFWAKSRN
jgi:molecular chaperone DnaJ